MANEHQRPQGDDSEDDRDEGDRDEDEGENQAVVAADPDVDDDDDIDDYDDDVPRVLERVRIDKWLWAARFYKSRVLATQAVEGGKVKIAGERVKPARDLKLGETLTVSIGEYEWEVLVRALGVHRGPAVLAQELYEETEESQDRRALQIANKKAFPEPAAYAQKGRPVKRDRRGMDQARGSLHGGYAGPMDSARGFGASPAPADMDRSGGGAGGAGKRPAKKRRGKPGVPGGPNTAPAGGGQGSGQRSGQRPPGQRPPGSRPQGPRPQGGQGGQGGQGRQGGRQGAAALPGESGQVDQRDRVVPVDGVAVAVVEGSQTENLGAVQPGGGGARRRNRRRGRGRGGQVGGDQGGSRGGPQGTPGGSTPNTSSGGTDGGGAD